MYAREILKTRSELDSPFPMQIFGHTGMKAYGGGNENGNSAQWANYPGVFFSLFWCFGQVVM